MIALDTLLQYLKGVGPRRAADLQRVGLTSVEDLLYRFPTRYEDRGAFQTIASLRPATAASVAGEVLSCGVRPTRRPRFKIFEMLVRDATGVLRAVFFNQPFLSDVFHPHQRVITKSSSRTPTPTGEPREKTRRCIPGASCRFTRRPERSRPRCSARSCIGPSPTSRPR
jgi:RecG-like helicase